MITYPSTHGVFEDGIRDDLRHRPRARRPGVHGRRQHERAGRADEPGGDRRGRVSPEPAQDVCHPARRRRPGHGADRRGAAPGAVSCPGHPLVATGGEPCDSRGVGGAVGERQHPADFVRLHPDARRGGRHRRHALRDSERQLHQGSPRAALSRCSTRARTAAWPTS